MSWCILKWFEKEVMSIWNWGNVLTSYQIDLTASKIKGCRRIVFHCKQFLNEFRSWDISRNLERERGTLTSPPSFTRFSRRAFLITILASVLLFAYLTCFMLFVCKWKRRNKLFCSAISLNCTFWEILQATITILLVNKATSFPNGLSFPL